MPQERGQCPGSFWIRPRSKKYSSATFLINQGIPTRIDSVHAIAHNKVMIIDGETVITAPSISLKRRRKISENLLYPGQEAGRVLHPELAGHPNHSEIMLGRDR